MQKEATLAAFHGTTLKVCTKLLLEYGDVSHTIDCSVALNCFQVYAVTVQQGARVAIVKRAALTVMEQAAIQRGWQSVTQQTALAFVHKAAAGTWVAKCNIMSITPCIYSCH